MTVAPEVAEILKSIESNFKKLDNIEKTAITLAVHANQIKVLECQVTTLWGKYDEAFGQKGIIPELKTEQNLIIARQENCQVKTISTQVKIMWAAIFGMALSIVIKFATSGPTP